MWDLIVSIPDHCLLFTLYVIISVFEDCFLAYLYERTGRAFLAYLYERTGRATAISSASALGGGGPSCEQNV